MRKRNYYLLLLAFLPLILLGSCSNESAMTDYATQGDAQLRSVTVRIDPIGITTRSVAESDILSTGIAERVEAGQSMLIELNGKSAAYVYNGKSWVPEGEPLSFYGKGKQNLNITLTAPEAKQDGTFKGLLAADKLIYQGTVAANSELKDISLVHSKMLLEIEPEGVTVDKYVEVDGEKAYYDKERNRYLLVLENTNKDVKLSYNNGNSVLTHTVTLSGKQLEPNWLYRIKITEKGAELEIAEAIESITATIDGVPGLDEVIKGFTSRKEAGQVMTVAIGGNSAIYVWNGTLWIPQSMPLKYPEGMRHNITLTLAKSGAVQDGTEAAFLSADALTYEMTGQLRLTNLTGITLKRTMSLVNLAFKSNGKTVGNVKTDGVRAVKVSSNNYKVLLAPSSKRLEVSFSVNESVHTTQTQLIELAAGKTVTLEVEVSDNASGRIDYAIDDLGLPEYIAGTKGNGPIVKLLNDGSYKVFMQNAAGVAGIKTVQEVGALDVYPSNPGNRFRVGLHNDISTAQWKFEQPAKTLVVTDLHGEFNAFVDILKTQHVVDEHFNWVYGKNFLVVNGDAVHRGRDEVAILWLLYKLEAQAEYHGGKCIYLSANHDDFLLQKSNTIFRNSANKDFANNLIQVEKGVIRSYEDLFESSYVLGKWLRQRNSVIVVGNDAFVHAGIGRRMVNNNFSIPQINEIAKRNIGLSDLKRDREGREVFNVGLIGGGTYWLRTMIHRTMSESELNTVLNYYNVNRVICGHTEVSDIAWYYNGRVIGANVQHRTNWANRFKTTWSRETSAALLIEGKSYYMVDYNGNKSLIGVGN